MGEKRGDLGLERGILVNRGNDGGEIWGQGGFGGKKGGIWGYFRSRGHIGVALRSRWGGVRGHMIGWSRDVGWVT